ncbi:hypothetical protein NQ317_019185 [Molorchus minor]|uniref:C2H2-type domain-containing protein n=1 Tax=Molorchus minor TaxID=1323400 RepID=A0ABQ9J6Q3_9CUCU|nr:hypothetical protein NQ317_019185 [Molorchus minor]
MDITCRLCSGSVDNENYIVLNKIYIEVLEAVLLKINVSTNETSIMCKECSVKLEKCFQFKALCLDSEDTVSPYISENKMDLKDVYLQCNNLKIISNDLNVCRLCMQCMKNECLFTFTELENDPNLMEAFQKYIPEVVMEFTFQIFVCKSCIQSLNVNYNFIKMCLDNEDQLVNDSKFESIEDNIVYELNISDVDMGDASGDTEGIETKQDSITKAKPKLKKKYSKTPRHTTNSATKKSSVPTCPNCQRTFKSDICLQKHSIVHQDPSEIQMQKCPLCDFQTKYKGSLLAHSIIHTGKSKLKKFKCKTCRYVTVRKSNYTKHLETHKDISDLKFKCAHCSYATSRTDQMKMHVQNRHEDRSKLATFKCELCSYETIRKPSLKRHMISHLANPANIFSCDQCSFKTKWSASFKNHMVTHLQPQELQTYKCFHCSHETKLKGQLIMHMLSHKDPSHIDMFKCDQCSFETKYRGHLMAHVEHHRDQTEVTMYKCDLCNYESRFSRYVKQHMARHAAEPKYKCTQCPFATKTSSGLDRHIKGHNKTVLFRCSICYYETHRKDAYDNHCETHLDMSERSVFKCASCSFQTFYKKGLRSICSVTSNSQKFLTVVGLMRRRDFRLPLPENSQNFSETVYFLALRLRYQGKWLGSTINIFLLY